MNLVEKNFEKSSSCSSNYSSASTAEAEEIYSISKLKGNKLTIKKTELNREKIYKCKIIGNFMGSFKKVNILEIYKKKKNGVPSTKIKHINKYVLIEEIGSSKTLHFDQSIRDFLLKQGAIIQPQELIAKGLSFPFALQLRRLTYKEIKEGLTDLRKIADVAKQQIESVKFMHDIKMVHLDIKPENFLYEINREGRLQAFLNDFDTARDMGVPMGFLSGSYIYMPSEAFQANVLKEALLLEEKIHLPESVDETWDIFSFGVILLEFGIRLLPDSSEKTFIEKYLSLKVSFDKMLYKAFSKEVLRERKSLLEHLQRIIEGFSFGEPLHLYFSTAQQMMHLNPSNRLPLEFAIKNLEEILNF